MPLEAVNELLTECYLDDDGLSLFSMRAYARRLRSHVSDRPDSRFRILGHYCAYGICRARVMLQVDGQDSMQVCYLHAPAGMLLLMRENPGSVVTPDFSQ